MIKTDQRYYKNNIKCVISSTYTLTENLILIVDIITVQYCGRLKIIIIALHYFCLYIYEDFQIYLNYFHKY